MAGSRSNGRKTATGSKTPVGRRTPARGVGHRTNSVRRRRLGWKGWLTAAGMVLILGLLAWGVLARRLAPRGNTALTHFEAIIVLGSPADEDGNPTAEQLARVNEAVREYERGVAPRMIMTGAAAHNGFVEAKVMAQVAHAQGIPDSAIFVEPHARDTIQNACYSVRIMKAHGWGSAEVISQAEHLPRAGLILSHLPIEWRTHACRPLQPESEAYKVGFAALETLKTVRYLVWTQQNEHCKP